MQRNWIGTGPRTALVVAIALVAAVGLAAAAAEAPTDDADRVDLNTADAKALETVPGIGPALAARIVAFREKEGPFARVDDLLKIRGIGEKSLAKIRPYVRVGRER
jgi:competence protein ComEA